MAPWASAMMDLLWQSAIAVIPLALLVVVLCRFLPTKPSTRHTLYLLVLAWLVLAPLLPAMRPPAVPAPSVALESRHVPAMFSARGGRASGDDVPVESELIDAARSAIRDEMLERDSAICNDRPQAHPEGGLAAKLPLRPTVDPRWLSAPPTVGGRKRTVGLDEYPAVARLAPLPGSSGLPLRVSSIPGAAAPIAVPASPPARVTPGPDPGQLSVRPSIERVLAPKIAGDVDAGRADLRIAKETVRDGAAIPGSGSVLRLTTAQGGSAGGRDSASGHVARSSSMPLEKRPLGAPRQAVAPRPLSQKDWLSQIPPGLARAAAVSPNIVDSSPPIDVFAGAGIDAPVAPPSVWHRWAVGLAEVRDAVGRLPSIPWSVWLAGSGLFLTVVIARLCWFLRRLGRASPAPPELSRMVGEIARSFELKRVPECLIVHDCLSPMIWCGRRARLLIPSGLWSDLDDTGRRAILCHELAHLRRRDHWVCWGEIAVAALYWWHPLLWWVRRRLHEEAELCCDAWVTWLMPQGRRAYAEALLSTKQYVARGAVREPALGLGVTTARAERFARRIRMVMTESNRPRLSIQGLALVVLIAGMGWVATPARSCPPEEQERVDRERAERAAVRQERQQERQEQRQQERKERQQQQTKRYRSLTETSPDTSFELFYATPEPGTTSNFFLASDDDDDGDLEERLERLEKQLQEMARQLERIGDGVRARRSRAPSADDAVGRLPGRAPGPRSWLAPTPGDSDETITRSYRVPEGRLEALTELMIRADVPVLVSPGDDHIEVQGTAAQQRTFRAFVNMIAPETAEDVLPSLPRAEVVPGPRGLVQSIIRRPAPPTPPKAPKAMKAPKAPKGLAVPRVRSGIVVPSAPMAEVEEREPMAEVEEADNVREYRLPEGKLEALTELMVRPDVPVLVSPGGDAIGVHGDRKIQKVFAGFVNLLEPEDEDDIREGEQIEASYELSEGKLEALTNLMVRPDVPVLVSPGEGEITVHGNKKTQKAFKAFIEIIEPAPERGRGASARTAIGVATGDHAEAHGDHAESHPSDHGSATGRGHDGPPAHEIDHGEHSGAHDAPAPRADVAPERIASSR